MNIPSNILCEDFKRDLTNIINNSSLPAFVIELVLQNYLNEVKLMAQKQYQIDIINYRKSLEVDETE